jgi:hypothetical protein
VAGHSLIFNFFKKNLELGLFEKEEEEEEVRMVELQKFESLVVHCKD